MACIKNKKISKFQKDSTIYLKQKISNGYGTFLKNSRMKVIDSKFMPFGGCLYILEDINGVKITDVDENYLSYSPIKANLFDKLFNKNICYE